MHFLDLEAVGLDPVFYANLSHFLEANCSDPVFHVHRPHFLEANRSDQPAFLHLNRSHFLKNHLGLQLL